MRGGAGGPLFWHSPGQRPESPVGWGTFQLSSSQVPSNSTTPPLSSVFSSTPQAPHTPDLKTKGT